MFACGEFFEFVPAGNSGDFRPEIGRRNGKWYSECCGPLFNPKRARPDRANDNLFGAVFFPRPAESPVAGRELPRGMLSNAESGLFPIGNGGNWKIVKIEKIEKLQNWKIGKSDVRKSELSDHSIFQFFISSIFKFSIFHFPSPGT